MSTRPSQDSHELDRAFDRAERDLLLFSKAIFDLRKHIDYLRASLSELADHAKLERTKRSDLVEIRSVIKEIMNDT